ncbi:MAG: DNA adenine methylase [Acidobacteriota bacterium]|nr:DNA adenine methylase [Acidobacteriota bacterium]
MSATAYLVDVGHEARVMAQLQKFPDSRYMGSKRRLLPWIYSVLSEIEFRSAWDPFSGSGSVSYLLKAMGKRVVSSDFLNFSSIVAKALIENPGIEVPKDLAHSILLPHPDARPFIENTWRNIFFQVEDLKFLDNAVAHIRGIHDEYLSAMVMTALIRSCQKRQPRGVFTISGDLSRYDDGRRDLRLSLAEHFLEQVELLNEASFSNQMKNISFRSDVFEGNRPQTDLVYLDPPYVPRSDDNCYIKRYHFLEGLSCYWKDVEIDYQTKVRKIKKKYTPFSYRRTAVEGFDNLFKRCGHATIALSYSSNGFPDLDQLTEMMGKYKSRVTVHKKPHRYHFGNHTAARRKSVIEYLIIGENA